MSVFLDACAGRPTPHTPIWLMRQAGRYQPEYRALREKHSFLELCRNPDLASEITRLPVSAFGFDAAIVFADILLLLEPLGVGFAFKEDDGPVIATPLRAHSQIDSMAGAIASKSSLGYVMQTIRLTRSALPEHVALIGFSGAPFTLASYMIEGGHSRTFHETKKWMHADPSAFSEIMRKTTSAVIDYLNAQIDAGVDAVQVFDSWIGCLSPLDYTKHVAPHMRHLFNHLNKSVPSIHFGTGNPCLYRPMHEAGGDVLGIDWRADLMEIWQATQAPSLMGNLDPSWLLAPLDAMKAAADQILSAVGNRPGHIFNLGHGIDRHTDPNQVKYLVEYVHTQSARLRA